MARKRKFVGEDGKKYIAKEKKPLYKKWWFWLIAIIFVGAALGGGDERLDSETPESTVVKNTESANSSDNVSELESEPVDEVEEVELVVGMGQEINVGKVAYIVNSMETASNVGGEWGQNSKGTYLIVNLTVTNNGDDALTVDNSLFKLINDGKEYDSDSAAGIYANEEHSFFLESINPELSLTGDVVFDVSDTVVNSTTKQLQVSTGFWGTEKGLINLQ